jgi:protein O-mannosyl-transferase
MQKRLLILMLFSFTLIFYWKVRNYEFVNYDDHMFVYNNPIVNQGFSWGSVKAALFDGCFLKQSEGTGYWAPVSELSHMLDFQLYGDTAFGHHVTNVVIHALNVCLLFILVSAIGLSLWQAISLAVIFAIHPQNVESVAWVVERKGLLSTCFVLLSMLSYLKYIRQSSRFFYWSSVVFFALALSAKVTVASVPCLFLLLDLWPLRRIKRAKIDLGMLKVCLEKVPFFALSLFFSLQAVSYMQSAGNLKGTDVVSIGDRIGNAVVSYWTYLFKTIYLGGFSVFYPLQQHSVSKIVLAGSFVLLGVLCSFRWARRRPELFLGWWWYILAFLPTIGLVQAGEQGMADRYFYLPGIGLFICLVSISSAVLSRMPSKVWWVRHCGLAVVFVFLAVMSGRQLAYWKSSLTLFPHSNEVTGGNLLAYNNYGAALSKKDDFKGAVDCFKAALRLKPDYVLAHANLGLMYLNMDRRADAEKAFRNALKYDPHHPGANNFLGVIAIDSGRIGEGRKFLYQALKKEGRYGLAYYNLGKSYALTNQTDRALHFYHLSIKFDPLLADAHFNASNIYRDKGDLEKAKELLVIAVQMQPSFVQAYNNLGIILSKQGDLGYAIQAYDRALELKEDMPDVHYNKAIALLKLNDPILARKHLERALEIKPGYPNATNALDLLLNNSKAADGDQKKIDR